MNLCTTHLSLTPFVRNQQQQPSVTTPILADNKHPARNHNHQQNLPALWSVFPASGQPALVALPRTFPIRTERTATRRHPQDMPPESLSALSGHARGSAAAAAGPGPGSARSRLGSRSSRDGRGSSDDVMGDGEVAPLSAEELGQRLEQYRTFRDQARGEGVRASPHDVLPPRMHAPCCVAAPLWSRPRPRGGTTLQHTVLRLALPAACDMLARYGCGCGRAPFGAASACGPSSATVHACTHLPRYARAQGEGHIETRTQSSSRH